MTSSIQSKYPATPLARTYEAAKAEAKEGNYTRINKLISGFALEIVHPAMKDDPATCYRIANRMLKLNSHGANGGLPLATVNKALKQLYSHGVFSPIFSGQEKTRLLSKSKEEVSVNTNFLRFFCKGIADAKEESAAIEMNFSVEALRSLKEILYNNRLISVCSSLDELGLAELYALAIHIKYSELSDVCHQIFFGKWNQSSFTEEKLEAFVLHVDQLDLPEERRIDLKLGGLKGVFTTRKIPFTPTKGGALSIPAASISAVQKGFSSEALSALVLSHVTGFSVKTDDDVEAAALLAAMSEADRGNVTEFTFWLENRECSSLFRRMPEFFPNVRHLNLYLGVGEKWWLETLHCSLELKDLIPLTATLKQFSALEAVTVIKKAHAPIEALSGTFAELEQLQELPAIELGNEVKLELSTTTYIKNEKEKVESLKAFSGYDVAYIGYYSKSSQFKLSKQA